MRKFANTYLKKIEAFLKHKEEKTELLVIGGLALSFYGVERFTLDIDAEIHCHDKTYFELIEY